MLKKLLALVVMLFATMAMAAVDVNKATDAELDSVKGIGPITSKLILSERKKGAFKNWQDFIDRVKGVGDNRAAKLSAEGLTVNGTSFKGAAVTKKDDKAAAKEEKAAAKEAKKDAKVVESKPVASAARTSAAATPAASAAKPAASAKK